MSGSSSVVVEEKEPLSTNKSFEPFSNKTNASPVKHAAYVENVFRGMVESLGTSVACGDFLTRSATAVVNNENTYSQREKEIVRQIERISPYIKWVVENEDKVAASEQFQRSARAVIGLLHASTCLPTPIPTSSVDIEKGASLFLNDDVSYFDIEVFDDIVEFYAKDKNNGEEYYGEEHIKVGQFPSRLLTTLYKLYARN